MALGDAREGEWRGNWRMEWIASTLHTTSEHGVSSITTADAHISAASSRLNWRPRRFKWTLTFRRKTKSGSRACAITFQTQSTYKRFGTTWQCNPQAPEWMHSERTVLTVTTSIVTVFSLFRRCLIAMNTLKFAKSLCKLLKQQFHCQKPPGTWPLLLWSKAAMFTYCHVDCA
jgi:hypothetical protein